MDYVLLEKQMDGIAVIRLNRPEAKNALNVELRKQLTDHFNALGSDPAIRCIVLTGGDECFVAGADIKDMVELSAIEMYHRNIHLMWRAISDCPKPIIAAVNGFALGAGCELAMHADIILAGENACFGQPEIKVGIMPGAGGTQRLTRAIGKYQAMWMLLAGKTISGKEAFAMGLCSQVVPDAEVQDLALKLAQTIAGMPPIAVAQIKEVVRAGQDMHLDSALILERKAFQLLFASEDQQEGMTAFIEKRRPVYKGR